VRPSDVVLLHDPQTTGMVGPLVEKGVPVVWRAYIGRDAPNDLAREAWRFLIGVLTAPGREAQRVPGDAGAARDRREGPLPDRVRRGRLGGR
jgi:hypothetical protein